MTLATTDDPRFKKAAARWHARYVLATDAGLGESEMVMKMLGGLHGANALLLQRRLLERVAASGVADDEMADAQPRRQRLR